MSKTPAPGKSGPRRKPRASTRLPIVLASLVVGGGGGLLASWVVDHINQLNEQIATLEITGQRAADEAREQTARADLAERSARDATAAQEEAQAETETARTQAMAADQRAAMAIERAADAQATSLAAQAEARRVQEQAEATRRAAEAEMNRLSDALGRIAETRRTALGLVMNLDEGYVKFDFDQAALRQESREILSRIAGILFTSEDFAITISGHTDARGNDQYNQRLSERRAQAVADYLIEAGLARERFTVQGLGKAYPVDTGASDEAHARNRRVELGIVSARIVDSPQIEP